MQGWAMGQRNSIFADILPMQIRIPIYVAKAPGKLLYPVDSSYVVCIRSWIELMLMEREKTAF